MLQQKNQVYFYQLSCRESSSLAVWEVVLFIVFNNFFIFMTHIPEMKELTEEQKVKLDEKKKEKKLKQREKQKEKKAQMKEEAEEQVRCCFISIL